MSRVWICLEILSGHLRGWLVIDLRYYACIRWVPCGCVFGVGCRLIDGRADACLLDMSGLCCRVALVVRGRLSLRSRGLIGRSLSGVPGDLATVSLMPLRYDVRVPYVQRHSR